jgi:hypothetical protein
VAEVEERLPDKREALSSNPRDLYDHISVVNGVWPVVVCLNDRLLRRVVL